MIIRKANNVIDVFTSAQYWDGWARYKRVKNNLEFIKGKKLTQAQLNELKKQVG